MRGASSCTSEFRRIDGGNGSEAESLPHTGEFGDRTLCNDLALLEENSMRGHPFRLGHVVRGEDNRGATSSKGCDDVANGVAAVDIDSGSRLVEEDHLRVGCQGEGERDALLLSAREAAPGALHTGSQTHLLNKGRGVDLLAIESAEMVDDIAHAGAGVHASALQHDAHSVGEFCVLGGGIQTKDTDGALYGGAKAFTYLDCAGLAGAVGTENDSDCASGCFEGHIVHGRQLAVANNEIFDDNGHVSTLRLMYSPRPRHGWAGSLISVIDVRLLRTNVDVVREALARRGKPELLAQIDEAVALDSRLREITVERDAIRAEVNDLSKQVGMLRRDKKNEEAEELMERSRSLGERERVLQGETEGLQDTLQQVMLRIPNLPHPDAPDGSSDEDNPVIKGPINMPATFADHQRVAHWDTARELGILDNERATKISGAMFTMQRGLGATLSRALCQYALDMNADAFEEIRPPSLVTTATLTATGQLPKFADDAYAIERDDLWAIPTAEVPLTSLYAGEVIDEAELPARFMAYSSCYRREAGSAGRDTRGMLRAHEFDKVEILALATPEQSPELLIELRDRAERLIAGLGLPYRIIEICTGDMGGSHHRSFDIEVYAPGCDNWLEVSSVSWFADYQARRGDIRFKRTGQKGTEVANTLNGSALAVPRVWAAICENFRQADGSVKIPDVLLPYMRGATHITPKA